ncbi:MAG: hypothetical protein K6G30_01755 [Acetatifactor sp.]|nr:hypothetical protein [Acetatifactor sp.]
MMRYEWKKIFEKKFNVIAMLVGYALIAIVVFVRFAEENYWDEKTQSYLTGMEAMQASRERAGQQTDVISEEYITELLKNIQSYQLDLDSSEAYIKIGRPLGDIYYFVAKHYTDMRAASTDLEVLNRINLTEGALFYEHRIDKIRSFLNLDYSFGNYSEEEKAFWLGKAESVTIPFKWGYKAVIELALDCIVAGAYLLFVIIICVSPIFAAEKESGAADLLLTTKYGKTKLVWTKIGTAFLFTVGYCSVGMLSGIAACGICMGLSEVKLPIQLWNSVIPYDWTVGWTCVVNLGIILLIGVAITALLLYCSARTKSTVITMVIGMTVIIAPSFFRMSKTSGLWNHINYLFPMRIIDMRTVLGAFVSYRFGGLVLSYLVMIVIVYTLVTVLSLLSVRKSFTKTM